MLHCFRNKLMTLCKLIKFYVIAHFIFLFSLFLPHQMSIFCEQVFTFAVRPTTHHFFFESFIVFINGNTTDTFYEKF